MAAISEIAGVLLTAGGIIIGAATKRITGLLNKKKEETITAFKIAELENDVKELKQWKERAQDKLGKIDEHEGILRRLDR